MLRLLCGENNLEYTGNGYLQCGRHVDCPKKTNNKLLGFDCLAYIDNLPEGCNVNVPEELTRDEMTMGTRVTADGMDRVDKQKRERPTEIRTIEYVTI